MLNPIRAIRNVISNFVNPRPQMPAGSQFIVVRVGNSAIVKAVGFRADTGTLRIFFRNESTADFHNASWEHFNYLSDRNGDADQAFWDIRKQLTFATQVPREEAERFLSPLY